MPETKTKLVDKINVRMYRIGTGDFFLLQFKNKNTIIFNLMIDCGCINAGKEDFIEKVEHLKKETGEKIDLLIVTHEHADHINGFQKVSDIFDKIEVKKVWLAWTEADEKYANDFRKEHAKVKIAIQNASLKLNQSYKNKSFQKVFKDEYDGTTMLGATKFFIDSLTNLNELNDMGEPISLDKIPTMADILTKHKVIKPSTIVEYYEPGNTIENIEGADGVRIFVLGPPKDNEYIKKDEVKGEGYEKRKQKSSIDMAFLNIFNRDDLSEAEVKPFDEKYELEVKDLEKYKMFKEHYNSEPWRTIDNDWLFSAGNLALRHETSINNTSLVIAIQFKESEKILLFPGDAEQGSWLSWHDGLEWNFLDKNNNTKKVNAEYILNNTVFYKVAHHLSQNGTAKQKGLEMMLHEDLAAMVTLDFNKINNGWLNTMPNDLIGETLIRKTKGKVFFAGDRKKILKNLQTDRVTLSKVNLQKLEKENKRFDGKFYIEHEVNG